MPWYTVTIISTVVADDAQQATARLKDMVRFDQPGYGSKAVPYGPGNLVENRSTSDKITRPDLNQPDAYRINVSEPVLLSIEEGLVYQIERMRSDLMKCNVRDEEATQYTEEDVAFLADHIARLSRILFGARFLRNNPGHGEAD